MKANICENVNVPVEIHLVNHGLCATNLQHVLDETERFMPALRDLKRGRLVQIKTPLTTWTVAIHDDTGWCAISLDQKTTVAEFLAVAAATGRHRWQECLQKCRALHQQGLVPLTSLSEEAPGTDTWIALIVYHSQSGLSAQRKEELDLLTVGVARVLIEQALGKSMTTCTLEVDEVLKMFGID